MKKILSIVAGLALMAGVASAQEHVNFMFASVSPMDYAEMLVLSSSTAQQMD